MGAAEFARMKDGSYFINVARGSLVDEDALFTALTSGHLRGAGLDVTREEPPAPDCPLLTLDNVVLSPHVAALTEECTRRMSKVSVRNVLDAIDGRLDPELVVNKEVLDCHEEPWRARPFESAIPGQARSWPPAPQMACPSGNSLRHDLRTGVIIRRNPCAAWWVKSSRHPGARSKNARASPTILSRPTLPDTTAMV